MNDNELERIATRLGRRAGDQLDVERTATAVLRRLRNPEPVPVTRWWASTGLLRIAAAITITVGAGAVGYGALHRNGTAGPESPEIATLQGLSADELEAVLDSLTLDAPANDVIAAGLHDLDDEQLTLLLRKMEG